MRRIKHKKKWILAGSLLAVLLVVTVIPTYSWLFSQSDPVVNTFAGGTIKIKLDEANVDKEGFVSSRHQRCDGRWASDYING